MKHAALCCSSWPKIIEAIRNLCKFFRNASWRKQLIVALKAVLPADIDAKKLLKGFTATLANWRLETIYVCLFQLLRLEPLLPYLQELERIFAGFKDGALLTACQVALMWKGLWKFMKVFLHDVISPLEMLRRWGMVCRCHEAERRANPSKRLMCPFNSRRLEQARCKFYAVAGAHAQRGRSWNMPQLDSTGELWV